MSDHVLIRPGSLDAARGEYDRRRTAQMLARKRQLRDDELERLARRVDVIDLELGGLAQIRARELAVDLAASGFDTSGLKPLPLPTARRHRGRADVDPLTRARAEDAASRGRLIRVFTPRMTIR